MKKVLLITYYFDPANSVGTPRMSSWAKEFGKNGLHTTVVTRHWTGNEADWVDFLKEDHREVSVVNRDDYSVYYLPYRNYIPAGVTENKLRSKFYHLKEFLSGVFNPEVNAHHCFKEFCVQLLKKEKFDVILISAPPFNLVSLASELSLEFNIPFVVDFRDIWNNLLTVNEKDERSLRTRFMNSVEEGYLKSWLKKCAYVTSVSPALVDQIERIYKGKTGVVTNGYEENIFKDVRLLEPSKEFFTFSSIGTIYPMQDLSIFIEGLKQFYSHVEKAKDFKLNLIGIQAVPEVANRWKKELTMYNPVVTQRISRMEVFKYYGTSHLLYKSAWATHKGMYSTKIFEYIGACRNILIAPNDKDVVEKLITDTRLGHIANNTEEFVTILKKLYNEWKATGTLAVHADLDKIKLYSREEQARLFAESILSVI